MKQSGNSGTYTKERWIEFIHRMTPGGGSPKYRELTRLIESLSIQLPTDSIWKYLMGEKYFLE